MQGGHLQQVRRLGRRAVALATFLVLVPWAAALAADPGRSSPDAAWVPGHPDQVKLRAERSGTGDGRVYKVAVTVSDGHLTCNAVLTVGVPHDQSGPPAVDSSPPSYNSFGP